MNKYETLKAIHKWMIESSVIGSTPEGKLWIGIVVQGMSDAMGLDGSQERVLLPADEVQRNGRKYIKRTSATQQDIAIKWLRGKEHHPWLDKVDIDANSIDWLLETKCGVTLE